MIVLPLAKLSHYFFGIALFLMALFLILLVLVQRGRGGGLAGALGGAGGQSAFGAKAGDVFTKITVVTASIWIVLCLLSVKCLDSQSSSPLDVDQPGGAGPAVEAKQDGKKPQNDK